MNVPSVIVLRAIFSCSAFSNPNLLDDEHVAPWIYLQGRIVIGGWVLGDFILVKEVV